MPATLPAPERNHQTFRCFQSFQQAQPDRVRLQGLPASSNWLDFDIQRSQRRDLIDIALPVFPLVPILFLVIDDFPRSADISRIVFDLVAPVANLVLGACDCDPAKRENTPDRSRLAAHYFRA
jgi:hypothetical protein